MAIPRLPTFIVVPGACHVEAHYKPLIDQLQEAGYKAFASHLPGTGDPPDPAGLTASIDAVRSDVENEIKTGNDVILVPHSAGGIIGTSAIEGLAKQPGSDQPGVVKIIAVSAIFAAKGRSCAETTAGKTCLWLRVEGDTINVFPYDHPGGPIVEPGPFECSPPTALYNDLTEQQQREAYDLIQPIHTTMLTGPCTYEGWRDVPLTYILCEQDKALLPVVQEDIIRSLGIDVEVVRLDAGHSPFVSKPVELVKLIRRAAGGNLG